MKTILFTYDENNPLAKPTIQYLQQVGFIKQKLHKTRLDRALQDIEAGRVYHLCRRTKV